MLKRLWLGRRFGDTLAADAFRFSTGRQPLRPHPAIPAPPVRCKPTACCWNRACAPTASLQLVLRHAWSCRAVRAVKPSTGGSGAVRWWREPSAPRSLRRWTRALATCSPTQGPVTPHGLQTYGWRKETFYSPRDWLKQTLGRHCLFQALVTCIQQQRQAGDGHDHSAGARRACRPSINWLGCNGRRATMSRHGSAVPSEDVGSAEVPPFSSSSSRPCESADQLHFRCLVDTVRPGLGGGRFPSGWAA